MNDTEFVEENLYANRIIVDILQPWTEYKRRFWKNALGDQYESPGQSQRTQALQMTNHQETPPTQPTVSDQAGKESLKKLNDFIRRRNIMTAFEEPEPIPESLPFSAEMGKY